MRLLRFTASVVGISLCASLVPALSSFAAEQNIGLKGMRTRSEWGADDSYLFASKRGEETSEPQVNTSKGDNGVQIGGTGQPDRRMKDCEDAVKNYPDEFKTVSTIKKDPNGLSYLWPLQYSSKVRLLTVHHSALAVKGDPRPAAERVRALYKYHAINKGWGDIGYNFIVDEDGVVYEGRKGGHGVVAGHAYCNNVGTIGIVLLGNFEVETPTLAQVRGLQHLLSDLALEYQIDLGRSVAFHGKNFPSPIVGHGDLLSTQCPGYTLDAAFPQIVKNVRMGNLLASVTFPPLRTSSSSSSAPSRVQVTSVGLAEGLTFTGRTSIAINPSGKQRLSFTYTAGESGAYEGKKIAEIVLSSPKIQLLLDDGINWIPVTKGILLPTDLPAHETANIQLIIVAPVDTGNFWMEIGGQRFSIAVAGRRARTGEFQNPFGGNPINTVQPIQEKKSTKLVPRIRPQSRTSSAFVPNPNPIPNPPHAVDIARSPLIRIRLSTSANPTVRFAQKGTVGSISVLPGTTLSLLMKGNECVAMKNGERLTSATILRLSPLQSDALNVEGLSGKNRSYLGTLECRILGGALTLINELPLEGYMAGLAEEPDSEPYEKQRAFAIAARTYAQYYISPEHRKFPGEPYDGSDSPANFQAYAGTEFTGNNPNWQRAVTSTAGKVLTFNGQIIKPPYFSADDGRTRSPSEAGWKNFPFAEIFTSKSDVWCIGLTLRGHGVGMSGCGARGQALQGRSAEQILQYYYPGTRIEEQ